MPLTDNDPNSQKSNQSLNTKHKNLKKGFSFFSLFSAFIIIILVVFSALSVYILVYPRGKVSQFLVQNTYLKELIDLDQENQEETKKPINQLIGTDLNLNNLEFASSRGNLTVSQVIEKNLPSVFSVSIRDKGTVATSSASELSAGTAFVVDKNGILITNRHVVSVACKQGLENLDIIGINQAGEFFELEILSIDPVYDLAILRIKNQNNQTKFQAVDLSDSQNLQLGQDVLAIGNVLGQLQNTVTRGIISGVHRTFKTSLKDTCTDKEFLAQDLIQTDASINRGNSGGPLFNSSGQLIGINTLASDKGENIALAIPSAAIKRSFNSFLEYNKITSLTTDLQTVPINTLLQKENVWIPINYGELIYSQTDTLAVKKDSLEEKAGLKEGDIILEIDNQKLKYNINNPNPLTRFLYAQQDINKIFTLKVLKSKESDKNAFTYEKEPVEIKIKFNAIYFDLQKNSIEVISQETKNNTNQEKRS